jgi:hypothetical protein
MSDFQRNPWIIDTAQPGVVAWNGYARVEAMAWADVTDAGQVFILQDKNGKEVFSFTSPGPGFYNFFKPMWINGLIVAQLESGKLYLTIN